jgi:radical SAM protein with 4Fe4S-binding SPASM domain
MAKKRRFHLEVTGRCNLHCRYCYNADFSSPEQVVGELSFEEQIMLIEQAAAMGCNKFVFSGGEPFAYERIFDLFEACPETSYVSVLTNASLLDEAGIRRLEAIPQFRELKISLDGLSAHDLVRTGGSSAQVQEVIRNARTHASRLNIIVNTIVNRYSIAELCQLYETLKELGVHHWRIDMPFNAGRFVENEDLMDLTFREIAAVYRELLVRYFADGKPLLLEIFNVYKSMVDTSNYYDIDVNEHPCAYYNNTITVRPNGDLTYCPSLFQALANWREVGRDLSLADAELCRHSYCRLTIHDIAECRNCRYLKLCGGGCRADAVTWGHGQTGPDPINCSMLPLIEELVVPILPEAEQAMYRHYIDPSGQVPHPYDNFKEIAIMHEGDSDSG